VVFCSTVLQFPTTAFKCMLHWFFSELLVIGTTQDFKICRLKSASSHAESILKLTWTMYSHTYNQFWIVQGFPPFKGNVLMTMKFSLHHHWGKNTLHSPLHNLSLIPAIMCFCPYTVPTLKKKTASPSPTTRQTCSHRTRARALSPVNHMPAA
jgi:hypothetical protein